MLRVSNTLMLVVFVGALITRFSQFLVCLFCLEGMIACLFLGLVGRVGLAVSFSVVFFVSVSVAAARVGLSLLVRIRRGGGQCSHRLRI